MIHCIPTYPYRNTADLVSYLSLRATDHGCWPDCWFLIHSFDFILRLNNTPKWKVSSIIPKWCGRVGVQLMIFYEAWNSISIYEAHEYDIVNSSWKTPRISATISSVIFNFLINNVANPEWMEQLGTRKLNETKTINKWSHPTFQSCRHIWIYLVVS